MAIFTIVVTTAPTTVIPTFILLTPMIWRTIGTELEASRITNAQALATERLRTIFTLTATIPRFIAAIQRSASVASMKNPVPARAAGGTILHGATKACLPIT